MNVIEINKYRPSVFRHARYLSQDWNSFDQLGETWNGSALTIDVYLATEARYIRAIHRFRAAAGVEQLRVQGFERWTPDHELTKEAAIGLDPRSAPRDGEEVGGDDLDNLLRRCLRELAWMELAVPHEFLVHLNHDFRVIVATRSDTAAAEAATRADGLFTYPGDRGIASLRQWEEDTEGTLAHWAKRTKAGDPPGSR